VTPLERYQHERSTGLLDPDPVQRAVAALFDGLHARLVARTHPTAPGVLARLGALLRAPRSARRAPRGLYLWGGVGRGKTHLMNAFHEGLPFDDKLRVHFHRFMLRIHAELKSLAGRPDPLREVAARLAAQARVICFDEFHVSDITDAMLLGRLLETLFGHGVTLVATSNVAPRELYRNGLQRARFLPAIDLIETHTEVIEVDGLTDYRLRALERAEIYHCPLDDRAQTALEEAFDSLNPEGVEEGEVLQILGRPLRTRRTADGIAWFDFAELCDTPRSVADYVELARDFHTLLLAAVPHLDDASPDRVLRFIHLVDELYERNVNLIASAAAEPRALYRGKRHAQPFERTHSRLREMQSREYLARKHLP
jgi:cell division protein ZapE